MFRSVTFKVMCMLSHSILQMSKMVISVFFVSSNNVIIVKCVRSKSCPSVSVVMNRYVCNCGSIRAQCAACVS
jgi:hypothetical protein